MSKLAELPHVTGRVTYHGRTYTVTAVRVGVEGDHRPWRVEAPGQDYDEWLLSNDEVDLPAK